MKFEIQHRVTGAVIFALETDSVCLCVEAAVNEAANLADAYLAGANLAGAKLAGAKLRTKLGDPLVLVGERPTLVLGPLGSRCDRLTVFLTDRGVYVRAGCFWNTLDAFRRAVSETHGGSRHADEYGYAIALIECHAKLWTPPVLTEAQPEVDA